MRFVSRSDVRARFEGKRVCIVGSGPGVLENTPGFIDGFDQVIRVNNYKLSEAAGHRCDVFYSFFGASIKKALSDLKRDGVTLCIAKCPNAHAIESQWHRDKNKMLGVDFRWIYQRRANWWFCDTLVPTVEEFLATFRLLDNHIPTTGFAAIIEVLNFLPRELYLTGFDFFRSKVHNVDEAWREGDPSDPIKHEPEKELQWLSQSAARYQLSFDPMLSRAIADIKRKAA